MAFLHLGEPRLQPGPHRLGELPEHGVSHIQPMLGGLVGGLRIPGHEILQVDLPQRIGPAQLPDVAKTLKDVGVDELQGQLIDPDVIPDGIAQDLEADRPSSRQIRFRLLVRRF